MIFREYESLDNLWVSQTIEFEDCIKKSWKIIQQFCGAEGRILYLKNKFN